MYMHHKYHLHFPPIQLHDDRISEDIEPADCSSHQQSFNCKSLFKSMISDRSNLEYLAIYGIYTHNILIGFLINTYFK